ncbi:MAG: hypothetical protein R6X25_09410 [Candidatus Krumholzibacteriia bacterium]
MNRRNLGQGAVSGLLGGLGFGIMIQMMGTIPAIGKAAGLPGVLGGWAVHLVVAAAMGMIFALFLRHRVHGYPSGMVAGALYGGAWWLVGPVSTMTLLLGMELGPGLGMKAGAGVATGALPGMAGHLVYGAVLGLAYARLSVWRLQRRSPRRRARLSRLGRVG